MPEDETDLFACAGGVLRTIHDSLRGIVRDETGEITEKGAE